MRRAAGGTPNILRKVRLKCAESEKPAWWAACVSEAPPATTWSKAEQCWVDEKFHILENVSLFDREKARRHPQARRQPTLPLSSFVWNDVVFRSFRAGNLKSIRSEEHTSELQSPC